MPSKVVYSSASVRLTHKTIENAKGPKLLRHNGDVALVVRVSPKGAKTFLVMPRIPVSGTQRKTRARIVLGRFPEMSLEKAFEKAHAAYREAKAGRNIAKPEQKPIGDRFEGALQNFLAERVNGTRSAKETKRHFDVYVLPYWRDRPMRSLKRRDVKELLREIANKKVGDGLGGAVQADRVLTSVRRFFNWYLTEDDEFTSPVVRGMNLTNTRKRARHRVLTDAEIRAVMVTAPQQGAFGALVKGLLLTAQRRNEVAFLGRSEIGDVVVNGAAHRDVWTIPEARYKTKRTHVVPLSKAAKELIEAQPIVKTERGDSDLVFTLNGDNPVSNISRCKAKFDKAMLKCLGAKEMPNWTLHDLRRTAKTLMQRAGVRPDISERVLGHVIEGVEGTYDRYDYLREKREALEALAGLVDLIVTNNVADAVSLRA